MSGDPARRTWPSALPGRERVAIAGETLTRVLFGGRPGLALFCGSLALFALTWRVGVLFNDIGLFPTMLEYMADGKLSFGTPEDFDFGYPGMHHRNGEVYGRAYGLVAPALPVLLLLEATEPLVSHTWLTAFGWSALVLATGALAGDHFGQRRRGLAAGGAAAAVALLANAWFYKPLGTDLELVALQGVTMVAGAVVVVGVYRLLADRHGTTVGLLGGVTALLGTPVTVWATTPKRHTLTAMFVVLALFAFARSRNDGRTVREQTAYRGAAYAAAGLLAWVHAPEGFTLFAALALVDVPTAPRNDTPTLAAVSGLFALSLVPFFVTNTLVSGNPVLPPHFLDAYSGGSLANAAGGGADATASTANSGATGSGGDGGAASTGGSWLVGVVGAVVAVGQSAVAKADPAVALVERGVDMYLSGSVVLATEPERVFRTFVRWGGSASATQMTLFLNDATNLSVIESAPVVVGMVALPLRRRVAKLRSGTLTLRDSVDPVDLVVVVFSLLFACLYINRLPVRLMVTVRYLHPLYPVAVYGLFRLPQVRSLLVTQTRSAVLGYEATVLLGLPLSYGALLLFETTNGRVVQSLGLVSLAVATVLVVSLLAGTRDERADPVAAGAFGAAVGVTTMYLLLTSVILFHHGPSALPAVDVFSDELRRLVVATN